MEKLNWKDELLNIVMQGRVDYEVIIKEIVLKHHKYSLNGRNIADSGRIVARYLLG